MGSGSSMAKRVWARELVEKAMHGNDYAMDSPSQRIAERLLRAERRRTLQMLRVYFQEVYDGKHVLSEDDLRRRLGGGGNG